MFSLTYGSEYCVHFVYLWSCFRVGMTRGRRVVFRFLKRCARVKSSKREYPMSNAI